MVDELLFLFFLCPAGLLWSSLDPGKRERLALEPKEEGEDDKLEGDWELLLSFIDIRFLKPPFFEEGMEIAVGDSNSSET